MVFIPFHRLLEIKQIPHCRQDNDDKDVMDDNEEAKRLEAARTEKVPWKKWGPYLSERQWGTVREDFSENRMPGITFPMIRRVPGHTAGERMG